MFTLAAWVPGTRHGVDDVLLGRQEAAMSGWEAGQQKPKTRELLDIGGAAGTAGCGFGGMLLFLFFLGPLLGMVIGGDQLGPRRDVGLDDDFLREVRDNARG
jgi:uncharacterized membrane protein